MNWGKISLVTRREYIFNFRRPAFLFTAFVVPLISLAATYFVINFVANQETDLSDFARVGYVDLAGVVRPAAPSDADYFPITDPAGDDAASYAEAQLLAGELDAYFIVSELYVYTGEIDVFSTESAPEALKDNIRAFMADQVSFAAPEESVAVPITRLTDLNYTIRDVDSGEELSEAAFFGRLFMPMIFVVLYFMATNTTAQFLMSGVVEEKENRLMEILATSLRPLELLWGKLLGLAALALTQVVVWGVAGLLIAGLNDTGRDFISGVSFAPSDAALLLALFVINFLLFSASMLGIGASVTAETESRQFAGVFSFISVLPLVFLAAFLTDPNGLLPTVLTFIPYTGAVSVMLRMTLGNLPAWQLWLSVGIQVASVIAVTWLAAKVFRLGMLMYGKRLSVRLLIAALREGRSTLTTASTEFAPAEAGAISGRELATGRKEASGD